MFRILIGLCILGASLANTVFPGGVPMPDGRIVGGEDADIREFPHQISMRYKGNHRCGGTIVASNIIVSAAHCVNTLANASNLTIVAGSTTLFQLSDNAQVLPVRKFIIHDKYRTLNNDNDAAILLLDGDFEFNEFVQPIPLATELPQEGTPVTVTGWGVTTENGYLPNILQKVIVNVVDNAACKKAYRIMLTQNMMCAAQDGGGKDACQGDSGGPLIYNNQLLGIVSWGTGCARPKYPGVYAAVPVVRPWLEETIKANSDLGSIEFL
ncbi:hypothetical protein ACLKA7_000274 [Drosophila subpalustris]